MIATSSFSAAAAFKLSEFSKRLESLVASTGNDGRSCCLLADIACCLDLSFKTIDFGVALVRGDDGIHKQLMFVGKRAEDSYVLDGHYPQSRLHLPGSQSMAMIKKRQRFKQVVLRIFLAQPLAANVAVVDD